MLVLSQYVEPGYALELLQDSAEGVGYLLKDRVSDIGEFAAAVRRVAGGGSALDPSVVARSGSSRWRRPTDLDRAEQPTRTVHPARHHHDLPAGRLVGNAARRPSRIVQARYGGSATILPATGQATVTVPAKITITAITPRQIPWGATITITGKLAGGYLPPGGALIELRYSYGHAQTTYGVKTHVTTQTFTTTFTFGAGQTPLTFGFGLATLPTANYPYSPAASNILDVRVGGHQQKTTTKKKTTTTHKTLRSCRRSAKLCL